MYSSVLHYTRVPCTPVYSVVRYNDGVLSVLGTDYGAVL